jgi:hypothetical protein
MIFTQLQELIRNSIFADFRLLLRCALTNKRILILGFSLAAPGRSDKRSFGNRVKKRGGCAAPFFDPQLPGKPLSFRLKGGIYFLFTLKYLIKLLSLALKGGIYYFFQTGFH